MSGWAPERWPSQALRAKHPRAQKSPLCPDWSSQPQPRVRAGNRALPIFPARWAVLAGTRTRRRRPPAASQRQGAGLRSQIHPRQGYIAGAPIRRAGRIRKGHCQYLREQHHQPGRPRHGHRVHRRFRTDTSDLRCTVPPEAAAFDAPTPRVVTAACTRSRPTATPPSPGRQQTSPTVEQRIANLAGTPNLPATTCQLPRPAPSAGKPTDIDAVRPGSGADPLSGTRVLCSAVAGMRTESAG
jgi:hypothetical protein